MKWPEPSAVQAILLILRIWGQVYGDKSAYNYSVIAHHSRFYIFR